MKAASVGRRGFLRALGLSPIAAKAASDRALAEAMKVDLSGVGQGGGVPAGSPGQVSALSSGQRRSLVANFLRQFSLPDWEVERMRKDARYVYALDADIANKCWSMSVNILTQRERNFARAMGSAKEAGAYEAARDAFQQRHGFWFWW